MNENIEKLTAWHKAQVGTRETGENRVRYNTVYYGREVEGSQYDWCAAYIWCSFHETGLSSLFLDGGKSAYCPYITHWARQVGRFVTDGYREGDLLLYDWDGDGKADHIGYCIASDGSAVTAVEGNVSAAVVQVRRELRQIIGAYRPDYGPDRAETAPAPEEDTATEEPKDPATHTVRTGDTLWGIAERYLGEGSRFGEIMEWNRMASNYIYPGQVLVLAPPEEDDFCADCQLTVSVELPTLAEGSTGAAVLALQALVRYVWGKTIDLDGEYGPKTAAAVRSVKSAVGLGSDDYIDAETWARLIGGRV